MKKLLTTLISLVVCCGCLFSIQGCASEEFSSGTMNHNDSAWFTRDELEKIGLSGLTAPTGLTGDIKSEVSWFNNGYAFSQPCPDEATFTLNANTYFEYFKTNYNKKFGTTKTYSSSSAEFCYFLIQKSDISDYYTTNPAPSYKFYFVKDDTTDESGYYVEHGVYSLEIMYAADSSAPDVKLLKIFIEDAYKNHNGTISYRYKTR